MVHALVSETHLDSPTSGFTGHLSSESDSSLMDSCVALLTVKTQSYNMTLLTTVADTDLVQVKQDMSDVQDSLHGLVWVRWVFIMIRGVSIQSPLPTNSWVLQLYIRQAQCLIVVVHYTVWWQFVSMTCCLWVCIGASALVIAVYLFVYTLLPLYHACST